jgi:high-affinity iron transporter
VKLNIVFILVRALGLLLLVVAACREATPPPPSATQSDDLRRFGAILDYVAADYGAAVVDGKVVDPAEYEEQSVFLADARKLAAKLPPGKVDIPAELTALEKLVADKGPADGVASAARGLRRRVFDENGVVLAPTVPPSLTRGAELYAQMCVTCHGERGLGDGIEAQKHDPPPRSFHDPEVMADLSPGRAYNALTDGIRGTAMASFGGFPASDRWSLAFYVFTFRYSPEEIARGEAVYQNARRPLAATPTRLAQASDRDLDAIGKQAGLDAGDLRGFQAWLRGAAPFVRRDDTGAPLDETRRLLAGAISAYEGGDPGKASEQMSAAYLDGFEPHEGVLRARDNQLVTTIEERFLSLRRAIAGNAPANDVEREALQLGALLDRAEEVLGGESGASVAFASSLLIILREGIEAALLILLLLGMARRGGAEQHTRWVHAGWLGAAGLGLVTWFASGSLLGLLSGASRELLEGSIALLAAVVLLLTGHFVLARADAKMRVDAMKRRIGDAASGRPWVLAGLAFLAVYREAFEVVLFMRAITLDAGAGAGTAVLGGVAVAAVSLIVLVFLLAKLGKRIKPNVLLTGMGTLLCVLAVTLVGKGIRALQEAGVIGITPLELVPRFEWLGLHPTLQGVAGQVLVFAVFVAIALAAYWRGRRETEAAGDPRPAT